MRRFLFIPQKTDTMGIGARPTLDEQSPTGLEHPWALLVMQDYARVQMLFSK
ncbi:MAG: hypothetical protein Q7S09_04090 [bacterium]|nr:hypothetical protein [bacterium]